MEFLHKLLVCNGNSFLLGACFRLVKAPIYSWLIQRTNLFDYAPEGLTARPWKTDGFKTSLSFWDGKISGAMSCQFNFQGVSSQHVQPTTLIWVVSWLHSTMPLVPQAIITLSPTWISCRWLGSLVLHSWHGWFLDPDASRTRPILILY